MMDLIFIIAALAMIIGGWLTWGIMIFLEIKEVKSKTKLDIKFMPLVIMLFAIVVGCSPCRKVAGDSNYIVWVQEGIKKDYRCVENLYEADVYIYMVAGLDLNTDSLIGKRKPYFHFYNGDWEVYVEERAKGKEHRAQGRERRAKRRGKQ